MRHTQYIKTRLKSRLHGWHRDTGWQLGLNQSFLKNARGVRILVYHGLCTDHPFQYNTLFLSRQSFEKQLRLFKKYFHFLSLDDVYEHRFAEDRFNLCLSFDDGFANNYKYVLPLLEQYEVPACFFVTGIREAGYDILWNDLLAVLQKCGPDEIESLNKRWKRDREEKYCSEDGKFLTQELRSTGFHEKAELIRMYGSYRYHASEDYWLQMNEEQIRKLSESKWATIGSHGYYHNDLAQLPASFARSELQQSKRFLERVTQKSINAIAFPYGSYARETLALARECGYTAMLATDFIFQEDEKDKALKERLTINPFITAINQMHANIYGNYQ
ncbi:MAG: polysaccharide deacetylase family protein [Flavisolibacter sp.]